ncbi:hypothetical protein MHZ36_04220 [Staphylococcus sp. ACRSN]|uniref:hypothetical protein n=1 Tax=Staphylococcus sp. ACRSN TaxID=2918214 RepID=UPI001EF2B739|nr:hypothetical protein [Staphylococcus sp. ACRSN]MCG7338485.1 hypothetical protein [Staphylococcus sp. ACRSN]
MSDIIPFPRSQEKLTKEIKSAFTSQNYDKTYELIEDYERQFELDDSLALLKCSLLYEMGHFLELREEAIILLKQGITKYDDLMIFYIKSLSGLGQHFEVVEVIDQIIDEVKDHRTRMELFPLKEYSLGQLERHNEKASQQLQQFDVLSLREQVNTILTLIDHNQFDYQSTIAYLLTEIPLAPNVKSIILEYLRFAGYSEPLEIQKFNYDLIVTPTELSGLDHTVIKLQIVPEVLNQLEDSAVQILDEAQRLMNNHAIMLYPIDIETIASMSNWIVAYVNYFKSMLGLEEINDTSEVTQLIRLIDELE